MNFKSIIELMVSINGKSRVYFLSILVFGLLVLGTSSNVALAQNGQGNINTSFELTPQLGDNKDNLGKSNQIALNSLDNEKSNSFDYFNQEKQYEIISKHYANYDLTFDKKIISPFFKGVLEKDLYVDGQGQAEYILRFEKINPEIISQLTNYGMMVKNTITPLNMVSVKADHNILNEYLLKHGNSLDLQYMESNGKISLQTIDEDSYRQNKHLEIGTIVETINDELYDEQWGHQRINTTGAWSYLDNLSVSNDVLVAIIDTGIDYNHPDLDGVYVDLGYNWVYNNSDPIDDHSHGTHVAGIVAAEINNTIGIAGVAPVKVMAEKILDMYGWGWVDIAAAGIVHAVDMGADILSNSWGGFEPSDVLGQAIEYAAANGVTFVAAAGNNNGPYADLFYPAAHPDAISVSSTDIGDRLSYFSSYGYTVDVAAPGSDIISSVLGGGYQYFSGTSMAAPHVSAVIALMLIQQPNLSAAEIRALLHETTEDWGDTGFDPQFGYGFLDAENAVASSIRDTTDLFASIYMPTEEIAVGKAIDISYAIFNFGTADVSNVVVNIYKDGNIVDIKNIPSMLAGSNLLESSIFVLSGSDEFNLTIEIEAAAGEVNLLNNVDSEVMGFSSTYGVQEGSFNWINATTVGENQNLFGDDNYVTLDLPFSFQFYGNYFDKLFISTNGWMSFIDTTPYQYYGPGFPSDFTPYAIAPFWTDLAFYEFEVNSTQNPELWVLDQGDHIVIQYTNAYYLWGQKAGSFQVVLHETGDLVFSYLDVRNDNSLIGINKGLASQDATVLPVDRNEDLSQRTFIFSTSSATVANEVKVDLAYDVPSYRLPNQDELIEFYLLNLGTNDATSLSVDLSINSVSVFNEVHDVNSGTGLKLDYLWNSGSIGTYNFTLSVSQWANETNLANNVINFTITVATSRLGVPYNIPIEYNEVNNQQEVLGFIFRETEDPETAMVEIYYRYRITNDTYIVDLQVFNVFTFEDENNRPIAMAIPNDAGVGYEDAYGQIINQTTYDWYGTQISVYYYERIYGDYFLYHTVNTMFVSLGYYDSYYDENMESLRLEYSDIITDERHNQLITSFADNGNVGSFTTIYTYIRNIGSLDESGASLTINVDGIPVSSTTTPLLTPGEERILENQVLVEEGEHFVDVELGTVPGETFTDDNFGFAYFRSVRTYAIFQDVYPFGSGDLEWVLYNHGINFDYYSSADIGNVILNNYPRVILPSAQPAEFIAAVEANAAWFENYAINGGILEIHTAPERDYGLVSNEFGISAASYSSLPGGVGVSDQTVTTDEVSVVDREVSLFNEPYYVDEGYLNWWGYSAYGHLTDLPSDALTLITYQEFENRPVMAAIPFGNGNILYTVQPVEVWSANFGFLINLVVYEPEYPQYDTPDIVGVDSISIVHGSDSSLIWTIYSEIPDSYVISLDNVMMEEGAWNEHTMTLTFYLSDIAVGTHTLTLEASDAHGETTIFYTNLSVEETIVSTTITTITTTTEGGSSNDDSPIPLYVPMIGLVVATIIIRRFKR